ncbi:hypothetical protein VOLCADRAFT_99063 [Volvox carteri f. nagariensis]|uniref:Protein ENHANCED DISEASE RESISTANCE 2 C-terminal domain-containing protein n=1 Tax=Volvox carteri f. nagariensis TaxID=3068 RepID=D8UGY5_VOLCA|nr:uncharacterized protein VOLCADRAFT_99063 [Volvox carteri f. nagariensis]EFJ41032.1 hypothetical protein VOLCADRAFT_99063 [Volvox carteri f. nagariensis]|eukprot:XP_002957896.1 hypothetical protein VOLCADRAFT_99063 [Volvox carteri f. nagariensis]
MARKSEGISKYDFAKVQQPMWGHSDSMNASLQPLLEGVVYKLTRIPGVVVQRGAALFKDKCVTYHDPYKKTDATTWMLDRSCALLPASALELVPKKRGIRPKGTWAITAAVQGVETFVEVFEIKIDWPPSWAAAGYTDLVLGFLERSEAERWHSALAGVLAELGTAAKGNHSRSTSGKMTITLPSAELQTTSLQSSVFSSTVTNTGPSGLSESSTAAGMTPLGAAKQVPLPPSIEGLAAAAAAAAADGSCTRAVDDDASVDDDEDDDDEDEDSLAPDDGRWVPYRQTNGVAIYYHANGQQPGEGEYMVSCVIRGQPHRVAAALMRLRSNTTILGPAAHVELLQPADDKTGIKKEVLRLVLTASGNAGFFCAPREVILERMRKEEDDGVIVILFKSVDLANETEAKGLSKGSPKGDDARWGPPEGMEGKPECVPERKQAAGSTTGKQREPTNDLGQLVKPFCPQARSTEATARYDGAKHTVRILRILITNFFRVLGMECTAKLYGTGLFKRPVRATVAGGYTIAGLRGEGTASPETLVTCIVKVNLGGVCSSSSWIRSLASAAGWVDSFLDRILMSVHLLRDELEQRRFSVRPFKLVASAKARLNEDGFVVSEVAATSTAGPTRSAPSVTRIPKLTARMASMRLSSYHLEPSTLPAAISATIAEDSGSGGAVEPSSMRLDLSRVQSLIKLPRKFWAEVQVPGTDAPFQVRGPTYLKDKKKVMAGAPAFNLGGVELIELPKAGSMVAGEPSSSGLVEHVCRFLPSVCEGGAPFSIIICLVIPGSPMLVLSSVFCCDKHPSILGSPPVRPMDEPHDWQPFDFVLHKFVYGSDETRNKMLKLVPHIASGSWMIKQSVGTTPVIIGKALKTTYHCTPTYIEVDIDISANSVANYVTGMVRGATTSLDIDLAFVLEGSAPWELPECLLGAFRLTRLDCKAATPLDWSKVLPIKAGEQSKLFSSFHFRVTIGHHPRSSSKINCTFKSRFGSLSITELAADPRVTSGGQNPCRQPSWAESANDVAGVAADAAANSFSLGGGAAATAAAAAAPLLESVAYKLTRLGGVVVRRRVALLRGGRTIATFHHPDRPASAQSPRHAKYWHLSRGCTLRPARTAELAAHGPTSRGVRPSGTWAITAALQGVDASVQLFEIKIDWPPSWAAAGYTDLVLGFLERSEAERWHSALAGVLAELGTAAKGVRGGERLSTSRWRQQRTRTVVVHILAAAGWRRGDVAAASDGLTPWEPLPGQLSAFESQVVRRIPDCTAERVPLYDGAGTAEETWHDPASDLEDDSSSSDTDSDLDPDLDLNDDWDDTSPPNPDEERWVPYRQTNGVAIYYHRSEDTPKVSKDDEGEYMPPVLQLRVLSSPLPPAGTAGFFCAPRELVVEVLRKYDEDGVVVVMFKSVDPPPPPTPMPYTSGGGSGGWWGRVRGEGPTPTMSTKPGKPKLYGTGLFKRPVRATVAGGYTIAGLRGEGTASPETLVTCIVKVNLGGVCSSSSWIRSLASAAGWVDSFLDRILMSVHLLRDELEQRRFSVRPFKLVASAKARLNEAGRLVGDKQAARAQQVRGATYLKDRKKVPAGLPAFSLGAVEMIQLPPPGVPVGRYRLPRRGGKGGRGEEGEGEEEEEGGGGSARTSSSGGGGGGGDLPGIPGESKRWFELLWYFALASVIPGSPLLGILSVFCCDKHPSILGSPPVRPMDEPHDWQPFDFVLHKFVYGSDETRNKMLKLVPHIASGSWMIKQSVGTTPVIIGKALKTTYHCTPTYIEVDIDISANSVANYVTGMVRGATTSLEIDIGMVLEGRDG